ncbi:MAG: ATP-binding protein [Deltaproteobacteria bacterium]|nr:ATP-binding protein [Deltaproteobacteria bacterium]
MHTRELYQNIWRELARDKAMVFLAGPRQSGKTTLAMLISRSFTNSLYFNWDIPRDRSRLVENPAFFEEVERKDASRPLIILDEIHKYKEWKNYLKGVYDRFHQDYQFLVSGSGRLDMYQKGGDSLAGRYFLFHLWPFTLAELGGSNSGIDDFLADPLRVVSKRGGALKTIWKRLAALSGFPEPYLSDKATTWRRWSNGYARQLIREDIRDITDIKSVGTMETLYHLLPSRIASPLSIPSLARDLQVSYNSVQNWLSVFERFFLVFSIFPWSARIARAIQKERKVYLFDVPRIKDLAARFENMVALELWRGVTAWNDMGFGTFTLHFIKNKERQEVDFLLARDNEPFLLIEAKTSDVQPTAALKKFQQALDIPAVQLVNEGEGYRIFRNGAQKILVAPAHLWLAGLP